MGAIKYSTGTVSNTLKLGNFVVGNSGVPYGPTSVTGFYSMIDVPGGGYVIYGNKSSQGPSIYVCRSDSELITISSAIAGQSFTTVAQSIEYLNSQSGTIVVDSDIPAIVKSGLVLYLDAGMVSSYSRTGTTWTDLSGRLNNGTLTNGPIYNSSESGYISLDSTNDYVSVPHNSSLDLINTVTLETWVKYTTTTNTVLIEKSNNNSHYQLQIFNNTQGTPGIAGQLVFMLQPNSNNWVVSGITTNDNNWYHVVGTYDRSTTTARIYVNGVLRNTNSSISTGPTSNTQPLLIGSRSGAAGFGGTIGGVSIYNRVLSSTEILQNYNAGLTRFNTKNIVKSNLLLNLDSTNSVSYTGTGSTWVDLSGAGNHSSGIGSPTFDSTSKSFQFDATDDRFTSTISNRFDIHCLEITFKPHKQISSNTAPDNNAYSLLGVRRSIGNNNGINVYEWTGTMTNETVSIWSHDGFATGIVDTVTNDYHTMVFNWNGTSYDIWLDGVQKLTIQRTNGHAQLLTNVTAVDPGYNPGYNYYHKGNISLVRAYNRKLSSSEILQNYYGGPIVTSGLIMALDASNIVSYPGTGTTWRDLTSNGSNCTLTNGPTYTSTDGSSLVFDGSNDYLITPTITNFRTISLWIKTSNTGGGWKYLIDARPGMSSGWYTGFTDSGGGIGGNWTSQYVNGVSTSVSFNNITLGTWCNLVVISNAAYTSTINFMSRFSNQEMLSGSIGGIMIYDRVLTASEVAQNYNAQKSRFGL